MLRYRSAACLKRGRFALLWIVCGMRLRGALGCVRLRVLRRCRCRLRCGGCGFWIGWRGAVLLLVLHHIAGDGWSLGPLGRDLSRSYAARLAGGVPDFAPLAVQSADYTQWQQAVLGDERDAGSALSRELSFWRDRLCGLP